MKFLEKNLEDIIFETEIGDLLDRGLMFAQSGKFAKQVNFPNLGRADLIHMTRLDEHSPRVITVFELKQHEINANSFMQACRYLCGIKRWLCKNGIPTYSIHYQIVLIGKTMAKGDFIYIQDAVSSWNLDVQFYTYEYLVDGIYFNQLEVKHF
jgi:hypothetical protein